jgi:epoxyqueuosine reductase QueG
MVAFFDLKDCLDAKENLLWGIADLSQTEYAEQYQTAIVLAFKYAGNMDAAHYVESAFHELLEQCKTVSGDVQNDIIALLDYHDIKYLVPPPSQRDEELLQAPFSFKRAAVDAGIGWIGKNDLLITHEFGPRVFLRAVLADYPFPCDKLSQTQRCGDCMVCVDACPHGFIKGNVWQGDTARGDLIDYMGCNNWRSGFKEKLGRKHHCGLCLFACPYGK